MRKAFNNVAGWTEGNERAPGFLSTLVPKRKTIRVASQYSTVLKRANTKPDSLVSCMCWLLSDIPDCLEAKVWCFGNVVPYAKTVNLLF